ncbi:type III secretion system export apparatus subunit SctT [Yokenella regensburgei]|uniref:type III secretion system export apparatus subunit SctT n=1 Tax=Yokenella regensburgei TaxID=158877 RepID=UPI001432B6A8|nr:type III secretion system export apparatus subunit SctT [Yokenella regensburgei]QIU92574.1 SpaR/YscT/HrcT type III secretion system export apparatus protein [Yokenella regensburgei]
MLLGLYFDIHDLVMGAALGFARIAPVFFILPFLNSNILNGVMRSSVVMFVSLGLWPYSGIRISDFHSLEFITILIRESITGLLLSCVLAWPFWVFHALGCIIDNQRGATLSSSIDPANGVDTSELASFLNLFATAVYLQGGGMLLMLDILRQSYQICDPFVGCMLVSSNLMIFINRVTELAIVIASPIVITLLSSEVTLGLLSRFAPQMNAFAVSLTVKSVVALFVMIIYFSPILSERVMQLVAQTTDLSGWLKVGPP